MKVLAVGDIHRKWQDMSEILNFAKDKKYDKIVFVGDYADDFKGDYEDTLMCWDELLTSDESVIPLMGNHDFAYAYTTELEMLYGTPKVQTGFDMKTLALVKSGEITERELMKSFPISVEIDGVTYSHAGFSTRWLGEAGVKRVNNYKNKKLDEVDRMFKSQYSPIWQRPADTWLGLAKVMGKMSKTQIRMAQALNPSPYPHEMKQVFGHTPVTTCVNIHNPDGQCWCIDTFSTHPSGDNIGDRSILEIIDGKKFRVIPESEWAT